MVGDRRQQDALPQGSQGAHGLTVRGLSSSQCSSAPAGASRRGASPLPGAAADEGGEHQERRRRGEAEPEPMIPKTSRTWRTSRTPRTGVLFRQLVPDPLPHFEPVLIAALGHLRRAQSSRGCRRSRDTVAAHGAHASRCRSISCAPPAFAVVVEREIVFAEWCVTIPDSAAAPARSAVSSPRGTRCAWPRWFPVRALR